MLAKNREETLTPAEREEMEGILAISQVMSLAKAKARHKLVDWKDPRDLTADEFEALLDAATLTAPVARDISNRREDWYGDDGR